MDPDAARAARVPGPRGDRGVPALTSDLGHGIRLVPTRANGAPAFAYYLNDPHADVARVGGVFVLNLEGDRIATITRFGDTGVLPHFGLPRILPV